MQECSYSLWHEFYQFLSVFFDLLSQNHTGLMASISLVTVVQYNCCNQEVVTDHKFAIG